MILCFRKFYLSRDTLFIDFICCHDSVTEFFLDEAFLSVFLNDCYLKHIVLVVSPACSIGTVQLQKTKYFRYNAVKYFTLYFAFFSFFGRVMNIYIS